MSAWGGRGQTFTKLFTESTIRSARRTAIRDPIAPLCFFVYGAPVFAGQLTRRTVDIHGVRHLDGRFSRSTHAVYLGNFAVTDEEKLDRAKTHTTHNK